MTTRPARSFRLRDEVSLGDSLTLWTIITVNRLTGVYTLQCGDRRANVYAQQMTLVKESQ